MCQYQSFNKAANENCQNFLEVANLSLYNLTCNELDCDSINVNPIFVKININNVPYEFLLDTGASYTVISKTFFDKHLNHVKLKEAKRIFFFCIMGVQLNRWLLLYVLLNI